jgi:predicted phosphodiesterase
MRLAVISDIHANLEAFNRVEEDMKHCRIDEIVCLGDNIGYGPEPEEVVQKVRELDIPCVMGNHERAACNTEYLGWFNPQARISSEMTHNWLSRDSLEYISELPLFLTRHNCRFVHGFPPDSVSTYLFAVDENELIDAFYVMEQRLCFVGHTHELIMVGCDGEFIDGGPIREGVYPLETEKKYILNIGSIGQPRDGDNHAKYAIWDDRADTLEIRYVAYDIQSVVNKIIELGLPEVHAFRLL